LEQLSMGCSLWVEPMREEKVWRQRRLKREADDHKRILAAVHDDLQMSLSTGLHADDVARICTAIRQHLGATTDE
jgi:hypothetical protein